MLFVEVFRLVLVLLGALAGFDIGHSAGSPTGSAVVTILGALAGYVVGGVLGRFVGREEQRAVARLARVPPGELFAGTLTATAGFLLACALCIPLVALVHGTFVYPLAAAITWVFATTGYRVGASKGRQVAAAAGLSRILAPPLEPPPGFALLADASAIMDGALLVLGQAGLLVGGLVIPRFVIDQVQTLAVGPDRASSRRARRGLESLEALRELGVAVHIAENELPEIADLDDRIMEIGRRLSLRLATCSARIEEEAKGRGLAVTDLRRVAIDLAPEHPPGESLAVDLVRLGTQPRQAVGYLDDGDMVVVNDAAHMVGHEHVPVEVLSTRHTSQGLLVFARLASGSGTGAGDEPEASGAPGGSGARKKVRANNAGTTGDTGGDEESGTARDASTRDGAVTYRFPNRAAPG